MIIRLMGEMEIHSFIADSLLSEHSSLNGALRLETVTDGDVINWLGWALDRDEGLSTSENKSIRTRIEVGGRYLAALKQPDMTTGQFILLLILRERWPVGSKAKFRAVADRVGVDHTYHLLACPPQDEVDFNDEEQMSAAETRSLHAMVPVMKRMRKQFAASSGLQKFLQNLS